MVSNTSHTEADISEFPQCIKYEPLFGTADTRAYPNKATWPNRHNAASDTDLGIHFDLQLAALMLSFLQTMSPIDQFKA